MTRGQVNPYREAVVPVRLRTVDGSEYQVDAVVDTGFSEFLLLPRHLIEGLGFTFQTSLPMELGDGNSVVMGVYEGFVEWEGQQLTVPVHEAEGTPLVGMALLYGHRLAIDVIDGGMVEVTPLP